MDLEIRFEVYFAVLNVSGVNSMNQISGNSTEKGIRDFRVGVWGMGYWVWGIAGPPGAPHRPGYGYGRPAVAPEAPGTGYGGMLAGRTARGMGYTDSLYPLHGAKPGRAS